jgi:hypothetical protein
MANSEKDIIITPSRGSSDDPKIEFRGASATANAQVITARVYPTANGTLSFEGNAGQLFSITNSLTGTLFSVNDISGIPSIEVIDDGAIRLAQYSGNVGIGIANASSKLHVVGTANITGNVSVSALNATSADVLGSQLVGNVLSASYWNSGIIGVVFSGTSIDFDALDDRCAATSPMVVGKIYQCTITCTATGGGYINIDDDGVGAGVGSLTTYLSNVNSTRTFIIRSTASTRIRFIQQTVSGTVSVTGFSIRELVFTSNLSNILLGKQLESVTGSATAPTYTFINDTNTGMFSPSADAIAFTANATERVRITSSGLVGIGTSSPAYPLDVRLPQFGLANFESTVFGYSGIRIKDPNQPLIQLTDGTNQFQIYGGIDTSFRNYNSTGSLVFFTNNAEKVRIASNGFVGIGTGSPTSNLHVIGSANIIGPVSISNTTPTLSFTDGSYTSRIQQLPGYTFAISIDRIGSINWGTSAKLEFGNTTCTTRWLFDNNGLQPSTAALDICTSHTGSFGFFTSGTSTRYSAIAANFIDNSRAELILRSRTGGSSTEAVRINEFGNVGIGISSPTSKLHVNGVANITSNVTILGNVGIQTQPLPGSAITVPSTGGVPALTMFTGSKYYNIGITNGTNWMQFASNTDANVAITSSTNNQTNLIFQGAGQRGIIYADGSYNMGVTPQTFYGPTKFTFEQPTGNNISRISIGNTNPIAKFTVSDTLNAGSGSNANPAVEITQLWNTTGAPRAFKLNVTDTASDSASRLLDLQVNNTSTFWIGKSLSGRMNVTGARLTFLHPSNDSFNNYIEQTGNESLQLINYGRFTLGFSYGDFLPHVQLRSDNSFGWSNTTSLSTTGDVRLWRDAGNVFAQRNGTNPQTYRIYNTYTDASNYERANIGWSGNAFVISAEGAGTGSPNNEIVLSTGGAERLRVANARVTIGGEGLTNTRMAGIVEFNMAMLEKANVSADAASANITFNAREQSVLYLTGNTLSNWTVNLRGNATIPLNDVMATNQSLTVAYLVSNGANAYYQTGLQIDGNIVTPKWQGGNVITSGNPSSTDVYLVTVFKTGNNTFSVFESQTKFGI